MAAAEQTEGPPISLERLAESLSERLVEDESVRGHLTDDEVQPLLDWGLERLGALAAGLGTQPPSVAAAALERAGAQLRDLLRLVDLAVGERAAVSAELLGTRLQMLDTLLEPPLLEPEAAQLARARLEALLAEPPERLQARDGAELTRRLVGVLG